jgi:CRISPR-associated protein Cas5h
MGGTMNSTIDKILMFKLSGKFAHFRKFYTNASSLSYIIPPRTVIIGILASIMKIPRDEYYDIFSEDNLKISVRIPKNLEIRKQTQSLNYLHNKFFNLISKGKGLIQHSQCKLELLMYPLEGNIEYIIYVGSFNENPILIDFEEKLKNKDVGFGIYFGQRQFKADVEYLGSYENSEIDFLKKSEYLDSICSEENFVTCNLTKEIDLLAEQMPIHFKKVKSKSKIGREPVSVKRIFFEKRGRRIEGEFYNCYKINNKFISFY